MTQQVVVTTIDDDGSGGGGGGGGGCDEDDIDNKKYDQSTFILSDNDYYTDGYGNGATAMARTMFSYLVGALSPVNHKGLYQG